jgi:hypothetical protein
MTVLDLLSAPELIAHLAGRLRQFTEDLRYAAGHAGDLDPGLEDQVKRLIREANYIALVVEVLRGRPETSEPRRTVRASSAEPTTAHQPEGMKS